MSLLLALSIAHAQTTQPDIVQADWGPNGNAWGQGGKPKDPVVPEPAQYGLFMLGASMAWCVVRRKRRPALPNNLISHGEDGPRRNP